MQKIINLGRGSLCLSVEGPFPERFLNLCAEHDIAFWQVKRLGKTSLQVNVSWPQRRKVAALAKQAGFTVRREGEQGVPVFWRQLRKRLGLVIGLGLFAAMIGIMSRFVWDIEVVGNVTIPTEKILLHLQELGVGIGTPVGSIVSRDIKESMLLQINELSWLAVNVKGSRATVEVRERDLGEPRVDESVPCHLVARKPGVIVALEARQGQYKVTLGATVNAGDILASGAMESPNGTLRMVHAMGEVYARTWYDIEGCVPLTASGKQYTGRASKTYTLLLGTGASAPTLGGTGGFAAFDKKESRRKLKLPPGVTLPLTMVTEEYIEYVAQPYTMSLEVAKAALMKNLQAQLSQRSEQAEVLDKNITWRQENGVLYGRLTAECREQIAQEQTFDPLTIPTPTPPPNASP